MTQGFPLVSGVSTQPLRRLLPAAIAGLIAAAALTAYPQPSGPARATATPAGAEMMQMVRDEHAVIAGYLQSSNEQRQQADLAAEREILQAKAAERSEQLAAREAKQAATKTLALAAPAADKLKRKVATVQVAPPAAKTAAAMPLQLASAAPQIEPAPVMIVARGEAGPIRTRLRRVTAVVRRIPTWATSVAEWITDAVPSERLTRLPNLNILRVSS